MVSLLWVGPGMGDYLRHYWTRILAPLIHQRGATLGIDHLKMIDLMGIPKPFFGKEYCLEHRIIQETEKADFFAEEDHWDIILLDFIEAWMLGERFWDMARTPFSFIREAWEEKLMQLEPFQVWVRHDRDPCSTIIPQLEPFYQLVVDAHRTRSGAIQIEVDSDAAYWTPETVMRHYGDFHVWQINQ